MRPQSHDSSRHSRFNAFRGKFLGGASPKLLRNLPRRVRLVKFVWMRRATKSFNFGQFLAALKVLVDRFKFQGEPFYALDRQRFRQAARQYINIRSTNCQETRLVCKRWYNTAMLGVGGVS